MRPHWLWVGPKSNDEYPYKRRRIQRQREERPGDDGTDWRDIATSQEHQGLLGAPRC